MIATIFTEVHSEEGVVNHKIAPSVEMLLSLDFLWNYCSWETYRYYCL